MRKLFVLLGATVALLAMSSSAAASSTICDGVLTGQTIADDLVVPKNGSCTLVGTTVGDDVDVRKNAYFEATGNSRIGGHVESNESWTVFIDGGTTVGDRVEANRTLQVFIFNSTVDGSIEAWKSTDAVQICGTTVGGGIHVHKSGTDILIGDPLTLGCAGNTVLNGRSVSIHDNFTDVEFVVRGNAVQGGDLKVFDNRGPVEKFVQDNTGGDDLDCFGNQQPFTASGNTGWNEQRNQCAIQPTVCTSPLVGQTIPGDLVVPANASCTITNTTVGDDVKVGRNAYFEANGNSRVGDDVLAEKSLAIFLDTGTTVGDDVRTNRTFQVFVFNSTLDGSLRVSRSEDQVFVCGNSVAGDLVIERSGRDILVGDPQAADCAGNTVGGDIEIVRNAVDVELVIRGNTVTDDLEVFDNKGSAEKFVQDNTGGDKLECFGNEQPFTASGNTGWNEQRGQCAVQPTVCTSPLVGQTIPGDLVVPENASCTITNTTVGDDVRVGRDAYFEANGNSSIVDDVEANKALTIFLDTGTTVGDDVKASRTFQVFAFNSTLNGRLDVWGSKDQVFVCGNQIDGDVRIADSGRDILFGEPLADCGGNTVLNGHSVKLVDNFTDVEFVVRSNTLQGGDLGVFGNEGPVEKLVQNNSGDELKCFGNEDPFTGTPNTFASEQGQCAEL